MAYLKSWMRTIQLGIKSLLLHPMRSMLTVLGIFIGVASVIWLLAIGEGISQEARSDKSNRWELKMSLSDRSSLKT